MKPTAPRTLAATPTPQLRTPRPAAGDARFPSLALVLAGGALVPACADPACGEARGDELEAHGSAGVRAARQGQGAEALREIGVALGVVAHPATTRRDVIAPAGAPPPVELTPPVVAPPPVTPDGGGSSPRVQPRGGVRAIDPRPPRLQRPTRPTTPVPPRPMPVNAGAPVATSLTPRIVAPPPPVPTHGARRGDIAAVGPQPPRPTTS